MAFLKNAAMGKYVLILGGIVWFLRGVLENQVEPAAGSPQTPVDYLVIIITSLAMWLLALGLWFLHIERQMPQNLLRIAWNLGIGVAIVAAALAGIFNIAENGLGLNAISTLSGFSTIALIAGLLVAGVSAINPTDIPRITGWLLIICAFGIAFPDRGGVMLVGICLGFLGYLRF